MSHDSRRRTDAYRKGLRIGAAQTRDTIIARLPEIQHASPDEAAAIITAIAKDVRDGKHDDAPT